MKKFYVFILTLIVLASCRANTPSEPPEVPEYIPYTANPRNVIDPISVMKNTIEQQPAAYAYLPEHLEIDDQCIKLFMTRSGVGAVAMIGRVGGVAVGAGASDTPETICYKNIGRIGLLNVEGKLWRVEIDDKNENYMYWVYTFDRSEAERFIDAISNFVELKD